MKDYIEDRVQKVGYFLVDNKCTIRFAAKFFGVSKSTIHKDATERLPTIDPTLAQQVRYVLNTNSNECHLRGGRATAMKWSFMKD